MVRRITLAIVALAGAVANAQNAKATYSASELFAQSSRTLNAPIVYEEPGMFDATVLRFEYKSGLSADIYRPAGAPAAARLPLILCASNLAKPKAVERYGKGFLDTATVVSWNAFLAAGGGVAVAAAEVSATAAEDTEDFIAVLRRDAAELGIDPERIAVMGSSAAATLALSLAQSGSPIAGRVRGLAILYGNLSMMAEPPAKEVPVLVVIAGKDGAAIVRALRSVTDAMKRNGNDVTVVEYSEAYHAFDSSQPGPRTTAVLLEVRDFLLKALQ
jgi:dienelactone hydrolase